MPKEADLQKTILDYLRIRGCFVFKVYNGGVYIAKTQKYIKSPMRGVSDIIGLTSKGRFLAVEVKMKGGKVSPEQLEFIERVKEKKGIALIAYSIDDIIKLKNL